MVWMSGIRIRKASHGDGDANGAVSAGRVNFSAFGAETMRGQRGTGHPLPL